MDPTRTKPLGRTGRTVTVLGFGGATIGNLQRKVSPAEAEATVEAAWASGQTLYDTAPHYGNGLSERRIGDALREKPREAFTLSTKIGRIFVPAPPGSNPQPAFVDPLPFRPVYDYTYDGVMRSFEASLHRLGLYRIDILYVHDLTPRHHPKADVFEKHWNDLFGPKGGYEALLALRDQKVISGFGGGVGSSEICEEMAKRGDFDLFLLAGRYTLIDQGALASLLPMCEERGIAIVIGGPFNSGILATGAVEGATFDYRPASEEMLARVRRMEAICKAHGSSLPAASLDFPLHHPAVASTIPGARSAFEVERNVATMRTSVPGDLYAELKAEGLIDPRAPTP
ncbi:MAG: aldo/keto reductase [Alphaproteobacteria bacterium]|nr:aldo/keto reductase [Alphaproteobacteria bacterium]